MPIYIAYRIAISPLQWKNKFTHTGKVNAILVLALLTQEEYVFYLINVFFRVKVHGYVHSYPPSDAGACLQVFTVFSILIHNKFY